MQQASGSRLAGNGPYGAQCRVAPRASVAHWTRPSLHPRYLDGRTQYPSQPPTCPSNDTSSNGASQCTPHVLWRQYKSRLQTHVLEYGVPLVTPCPGRRALAVLSPSSLPLPFYRVSLPPIRDSPGFWAPPGALCAAV
jgi:hypothetical protein